MSADRPIAKTRRLTFAAIAVVATVAGGLIVACGSEAGDGPPTGQDGGDGGPQFQDGSFGTTTSSSSGTSGTSGSSGGDEDVQVIPDECANKPDAAIDCTGKCGPVRDFCTGQIKQCGGCPDVDGKKQACDLATNTCGTPKNTCADLGAECGTLKNSCGKYLDCPDKPVKGCAEGQECDPDTNKCKTCTNVTCEDLGYECGFAWLGCGPDDSAHQTDCGQCGTDKVCNNQFHKCEPKGTAPKTTAEKKAICDAAKASIKKVECGSISDGVGGIVDCSELADYKCKSGESCGVHGLPNRCYPDATPDECRAQGRTCGTIKSVCDNADVNCGSCPSGQVCNSNGVCGTPCAPKKCDVDFKDLECGTFDDGCGGTVTCGTCPGGNGVCDQSTNKCCKGKTCAADYSGKCGDDLPTGCGAATLDCNCGSPGKCTTNGGDSTAPGKGDPGQCCTPKTSAAFAGKCGTKLSDGCGGTINVACAGGLYCVNNQAGTVGDAPPDGTAGTCCTPQGKCSDEAAGKCETINNSCRPNGLPQQNCSGNCTNPKPSCVGGNCCTPAAACTGSGGENAECNVVKPGNGCGSDRTCACANGRVCLCNGKPCTAGDGAGVCKTAGTCGTVAPGGCGTDLDNGVGGTIDCGCGNGLKCSATAPGVKGTCVCNNPTNAAYTCANSPDKGSDACGSYTNGCGGTINCTCSDPANPFCNTTPNPNVCCAPAAQCTGGGGEGAECNTKKLANGCGNDRTCSCGGGRSCLCNGKPCTAADGPGVCTTALNCSSPAYAGKCGTNLDNGVGGTINCGCTAGHKCSETASNKTGTCTCNNGTNTAYTCDNVPNGPKTGGDACGSFDNGCGGSISCNCAQAGTVCFQTPNPNTCCTPDACPATPGLGTLCGSGIDNKCGSTINCGCPSGPNNTNWTCTANKCACTKDTCRGRTGPQDDLCGGKLQCGG